jgi:amino acid adenylation domain-containing protein
MITEPAPSAGTFVDTLRWRAQETPDRLALEFEADDGICAMDYAELDRSARAVAALLQENGAAQQNGAAGDRVLLVHPPGLDYVAAFLGCLYAGAVAVPVYPPMDQRGMERLQAIAADCTADIALCDAFTLQVMGQGLDSALSERIRLLASDALDPATADGWHEWRPQLEDLAFLQYTSGSTGTPKGVMVSHANLVHNSDVIGNTLGLSEASRAVSWLPPYHDMGLIGGILQPLHRGFPCTLMSPLSFLRDPIRWLRALSRTRATITAAPDFAYSETIRRTTPEQREGLDLSALRTAMVGAEPVRAATFEAFTDALRGAGLRRSVFYPCYGLAEATLFVTGAGDPAAGPTFLRVARDGLDVGRALVADADAPAAVLAGCGTSQGPDSVIIADPGTGRELLDDEVGEIWVSGPTVARGYWQRPDETGEVFGARSPDHPDRVFLRTGDLGFAHGGELFVAGRVKDLIVVRGRNHHPQDVEQTAESAHPLLRPGRAAVFAVDDGASERVVAVLEVRREFTAGRSAEVAAQVRRAVAAGHGLHVAEVVLVKSGAIPRTSSGKVRRAECRARWLDGTIRPVAAEEAEAQTSAKVPGRAAAELGECAAPLAAVLGLEPDDLEPDLPLISQGLDSLRAVRLTEAVRGTGGGPVELPALLSGMTAREVAAVWGAGAPADVRPATPSPPDDGALTPLQERIWLLDRMGAGAAYHISGGLRLTGPLDPALFERCLRDVLAAAPGLRSVFRTAPDGNPRRHVQPFEGLDLSTVDLSGLAPAQRESAARAELDARAVVPFDLAEGPLARFVLLRLAADTWWLGLTAHHIALDGWSLGVLLARLGERYHALTGTNGAVPGPMPELPQPDPAGPDPAREAAEAEFWHRYLDGAQPAALASDRPPGAAPGWSGAAAPVTLPAQLVSRLREFAAVHSATPFMVLLTAFGALLGRWADQDDLVVGTVRSGRDRPGAADVVGLLADTLPIRLELPRRSGTFARAVGLTRERCLAAYQHAQLPFDRIVRATGTRSADGRASLVRTVLVFQDLPLAPWQAGPLRAEPFELPSPGAQFELALYLSPGSDGSLSGHVVHDTDLFDTATVQSLLDGLRVLLEAALRRPDSTLGDLPVLAPAQAERIVRTAADAGPPASTSTLVHDLVTAAAQADPDGLAVLWDGGRLTYGQLEERARSLAARLQAAGASADQPVAIHIERSAELIVAVHAVLIAGAGYLPLDTAHPAARLAHQVCDAGARILVGSAAATAELREAVGQTNGRQLTLIEPAGDTAETPTSTTVRPQHIANVLYTSGSTGAPKGVATTHAALANQMAWMQQVFGLRRGERVLLKTPVSFDVSGWELLWPLTVGAAVVLARPDGHRDPYYLSSLIHRHEVTTCQFVPSMLQVFLEEPAAAGCARTLRRVICIGEELPPALARRFHSVLPDTSLHNLYGPTEAALAVTEHCVDFEHHDESEHEQRTRVPIGRPMSGVTLHVLDAAGRVAPPQAVGELHIGGVALARGYLGRPGLTADRFRPDPFHSGGRLYRTGDAARLLADGTLEYVGRLDRQLKIRGQRIEPAEIESVLAAHPDVAAAVVDARPDPSGRLRLVAWAVAPQADPNQIRAYLERQLPAGVVPDTVMLLPELPTGAHGKLDRSALPEPEAAGADGSERIAPRTVIEQRIGEIWAEVLGGVKPSVTDDFFELGGHSLLATQVAVRVRAVFGADIPAGEMLGGRLTIERLAGLVQRHQLDQADPGDVTAALDWMAELSDDEVASLLAGFEK